ncbi:MAG: xanthine dehydrogenase family protein molybdopterin-binding subunit [Acidobacteriota bacterium]|nr:xanthine dehydrogenase family protein molybdopterin-binding subunit [Acidobacteriota bacterium]
MTSYVGTPRPLIDGKAKVLGLTHFGTDQQCAGMLHARLVASPYAHAQILSIDVEAARSSPGVVAVLTSADLPALVPTSRGRLMLARDRVIFAGQPVAMVVAKTESEAEDGAEAVLVDYEPAQAVTSMDAALADGAPLVWPDGLPGTSAEAGAHGAAVGEEQESSAPSNLAGQTHFENGDVDQALAGADVVVENDFATAGVHQSYLEPHVTTVEPNLVTGGATVYPSTQAAFFVRQEIAHILGVAESEVNVVPAAIGGGFGGKFLLHDPLVALAARKLARPIRLVLSRGEELAAGTPAPATHIRIKLGATSDGDLVALDADFLMDDGCYPSSITGLAGILLGSPYPLEDFRIRAREVLTFKPSVGAYRAPCAPQVAFALEQTLDQLAEKLDMDPLELRLRNAASPGDPMAHRAPWGNMGMKECLETLKRHPAWQARGEARAKGRGVGIAIGGWPGGTEPAASSCSLQRDGTLHVHVGSVDITGTTTSFALLAAETFGLDPDKIRIISGDTDNAPYAGASGGSKTLYTVGSAVVNAVDDAREQTLSLASEMLEADAADLEIVNGNVQVKGAPDQAIPLAKIAARTMRFHGKHAPVWGHGRHANNTQSPGFSAQLAEVEVDADTGEVRIHKLIVVQDAGRAINPAAVEGQMLGGALQGVGWALYEALSHDADGQLLTGSLMDYTVPNMNQTPDSLVAEIIEIPSDIGPMGARGVGEPPVIPTAAAVANAVTDATSARLTELPMTPPRVLAALSGDGA